MNVPRSRRIKKRPHSRGLAPLEMVLALPLLLFIMALMVNFGTVASWKVRGLSTARHAVWSSRWPRTSGATPRPGYWPPSAEMRAVEAGNVVELDDPRVDLPVARGPLPNGFLVHEDLLDPTRGLRRGESHLVRRFPMLAKLGEYDLEPKTRILDDKWQYQRTKWPEEGEYLPENVWRRIPVIYRLPHVSSTLVNNYAGAVEAIRNAPFREDLRPLELWKDEEFITYSARFGWSLSRRDLHTQLRHFCSLDAEVADREVQSVVDRTQGRGRRDDRNWIPGVSWQLTGAFISLYERVIGELEDRINAVPPPLPGDVPIMQAEIAALEGKISILEQFQERLESNGG